MCLAVPSKVISINEARMAQIEVMGVTRECSLRLVPQAQVGDYVLVHAGFAIQVIGEQEAAETLSLLGQMPDLLGDEFADQLATAADALMAKAGE